MFKKFIMLFMGLIMVAGCGDQNTKPLTAQYGNTGDIILIGMINLTPALDNNGNILKNSGDNSIAAFLEFVSDNDSGFIQVGTNRYFAISVPATESIVLNEIHFVVKDRRPDSNTEQFYHTFLTNRQFILDAKPISGEVYYLGNIEIQLSEISFNENIVNPKAQYIIARDVKLVNNLTGAQAWFFNEFPMANKTIRDGKTTVRMTDRENSFQNISQDIVYTTD